MRTRLVVNTSSWIASLRRRAAFNTPCRRPLSNGRGFLSDLEESLLGSLKPTITFRPDDIIGAYARPCIHSVRVVGGGL